MSLNINTYRIPILLVLLLASPMLLMAKKYDTGVEIQVKQYQGPIDASDTQQKILRIALTVTNGGGTPSCNGMNFSLTGFSELTNVHLYTTGQDPTFTSPTFLNTQTATGTVNFTFTGPAETVNGQYYYWLVADAKTTITNGITVDAVYLSGTYVTVPNLAPSIPNPPGSRKTGRYYTIGASGSDYGSVKLAADSIAEFDYDGTSPIIMELISTYIATTDVLSIVFRNHQGPATITIRPATIESGKKTSVAATSTLITFDGVQNIILDGRPGGIGANIEWSIRNTKNSSVIDPVIEFINDASNNMLTYLEIKGDNAENNNSGLITFSGTTGSTGNDNNTISYCHITDLPTIEGGAATFPRNGIYSLGTAGMSNSGNIIDNNHFYDIFEASNSSWVSSNCRLFTNNDAWTITNNHFYQNVAYTGIEAQTSIIKIDDGGGYNISGNFIGGTLPNCMGAAMEFTKTSENVNGRVRAISVTSNGNANTINGNTISNITCATKYNDANYPFIAIGLVGTADYTVGASGNGNLIGATSGAGSLTLNNDASTGSYGFAGILSQATGTVNISNNSFGSITVAGLRTSATTKLIENAGGVMTVDNNTFGSSVANNIVVISNSEFYAIESSSTDGVTVDNNTFQNFDLQASSVGNFVIKSRNGPFSSDNNTIDNISTSMTTGLKHGFYDIGGAGATITNNTISNISSSWNLWGLYIGTPPVGSSVNISNNSMSDFTLTEDLIAVWFIPSNGGTHYINNNTIGSASPDNISISTNNYARAFRFQATNATINFNGNTVQEIDITNTGSEAYIWGLLSTGCHLNASNNTFRNLESQGSHVGTEVVSGITVNSPGYTNNITGNTFDNLIASNTTVVSIFNAAIFITDGDGVIDKNIITNLENRATGANVIITGMDIRDGDWDIENNIVLLDNGGNTNSVDIAGIYWASSTGSANIYHNTVRITGTASGAAPTYSMYSLANGTSTTILKNNIFQNKRTGGSGLYYAEFALLTSPYTTDFNYVESLQSANVCHQNSTDYTVAGWQGGPVNATYSITGTETIDANGYATGTDVASSGTNLTAIVPDDYDGILRPTNPWMGAYEGPIKDKDSQVNPGAGAEPVAISSILDTDGERIIVMDVDIVDLGTADGLASIIDSIAFWQGDANMVGDWTNAIAGARLIGPDLPSPGLLGIVNSDHIAFEGLGIISVADGTTENYTLEVWLQSDLSAVNDNDTLEFMLDYLDIAPDVSGSLFGLGVVESGNTNCKIDIVATQLNFVTDKPPANINTFQNFEVSITATDENGNIDADETSSVTIVRNTGTGAVTSATGVTQNLTLGAYDWLDAKYNMSETFDIEAQSASLTNAISISINSVFAVVYSVGTGGTYTTIEAAYIAIPGTITQPYIIEIRSDYNSSLEVPPIIFAQKTGHSSTNTITVRPEFGVTGSIVSFDPGNNINVFTLNGCDYVIFDGRPGGIGSDRELTIRNTRTAATVGHAFEFINDAQGNTLQYLIVEAEADGANLGVIALKGSGSLGQDGNLFNNCIISDLTVGGSSVLPSNGLGSQGPVGPKNDNNTVQDCEFVDIFLSPSIGSQTSGIILLDENDSWTIQGNHFYQTADHANMIGQGGFIEIVDGGNHIVDGNYMGGRAPFCGGGKYNITSGTGQVACLAFDPNAGGGLNIITNNVISNFSYTTTFDAGATYCMYGMVIDAVNDFIISGNTIGSATVLNDVILTNDATGVSLGLAGIRNGSSGIVSIDYNTIAGITVNGGRDGATTALIQNGSTAGNPLIDNNILGGSVANSILMSSNSILYGIWNVTSAGMTVTNNTLQNFDHNATTAGIIGINNIAGPFTCTDNILQNITTAGNVTHNIIDHAGGIADISKNTIQDITLSSTGTGLFNGINLNSASAVTVDSNNIGGSSPNNITIASSDAYSNGINSIGTGALTCTGNIIQQINMTGTGGSAIQGISTTAGVLTFTQNTIQNITTAANGGSGNVIIGIYCGSSSTGHVISKNTVKNLTATGTGTPSNLIRGLRIFNGSGLIEKNYFSDFSMAYTTVSAAMDIINITTGTWDVFNNVVLISNGGNTNSIKIQGIRLTGTGTTRVHHNTVEISGNVSSGIANTEALYSTNTGILTLNNNIFKNLRTGTGLHYCEEAASGGTYTTNYNYLENTQAANLCNYGGTDYTLALWQGGPVNATNSIGGSAILDANGYPDPTFSGAGNGVNQTALVPDDKDGNTRATTPWRGAYEGCTPLSGQYTIGGAAPDYATFTAAISDLNACGINGVTTFYVRDGGYVEQIVIGAINGTNSSDTIVFRSEEGDSTLAVLSFNATITNNYTVLLDGASFISFVQLGLKAEDITYGRVVDIKGGTNSCWFKNNEITGVFSTGNDLAKANIYSAADDDQYIKFIDNFFTGGSYSVFFKGINAGDLELGNVFTGNVFDNFAYRGLDLEFQDAVKVLRDSFITTSTYVGLEFMYFFNCDNKTTIAGNNMTNATTTQVYGIRMNNCDGTAPNRILIANNFVQIGTSGIAYGMDFITSNFINIIHNSINITSTDAFNGYGMKMTGGTNFQIQNNISYNNNGGYVLDASASIVAWMDNNDWYSSGTNFGIWGGSTETNFANWQTATSPFDANSISVDPLFVSTTDLHLTTNPPSSLKGGLDLTGIVPNDIDGDTRTTTPWMGADEYTGPCSSTPATSNTWTQKLDFGGTARRHGVAFSIGNKGFIGTGVNGGTYYKDFWEYNPSNNTWTQKADFGGSARFSAVGFSIGDKGYIGTGKDISVNNVDFWEYDTTSNAWTQKANFGGNARRFGSGFSINAKGYIGSGWSTGYESDFWEYDPYSDTWTAKANYAATPRYRPVGFSIGDKGYMGTGFDGVFKKDFWEYNPVGDIWTQMTDFGGTARDLATGFSLGDKGYLGTGGDGGNTQDFWEYDPSDDTWTSRANFGGTARWGAVGLSIGSKGYIGAGFDAAEVKDFWEYSPPFSSRISGTNITCKSANDGTADLLVIDGLAPFTYFWAGGETTEDLSGLAPGTYTVIITDSFECVLNDTTVITEPATALVVNAGTNDTICPGGTSVIGGGPTASGGVGPYTYAWDQASTLDDTTLANPTATPVGATNYIVTATDSNNCVIKDTILVAEKTPMSGPYTVGGITPDYATITLAVADLICRGISANVIIDIRNGTYNEQVTIPDIVGTGVADSIIIQSESLDSSLVTWTFAADATNKFTLKLNSADRITIQHLTLQGTDPTYAVALQIEGGADSNHYRNNRFIGISTTVNLNNLTLVYSSTGVDNSNEFSDNAFINGSSGLFFAGTGSGNEDTEVIVQRNVFTNQSYIGIGLTFSISPRISDNIISTNSTRTDYDAIYCESCELNLIIEGNTAESTTAEGNGIDLLDCDGTSGNEGLIANNFVQIGVTGTAAGILIESSTYQKVYSNSVNLTSTDATNGAAFKQVGGGFTLHILNNIFVNSGGGYAMDIITTGSILFMNENDLFTSGSNIGNWGGSPQTTFTNWQSTVSPYDAVSVNVDPLFVSSTDLHLTGSSPTALQAGSDLTADVPIDIDGDTRPASNTWMGADEFTGSNRYWVGLTGGDWNDAGMWSTTSGGSSGASVPTVSDDVYFDSSSLTAPAIVTMPTGTWYCKTLQFLDIAKNPSFTGVGVLIIGDP